MEWGARTLLLGSYSRSLPQGHVGTFLRTAPCRRTCSLQWGHMGLSTQLGDSGSSEPMWGDMGGESHAGTGWVPPRQAAGPGQELYLGPRQSCGRSEGQPGRAAPPTGRFFLHLLAGWIGTMVGREGDVSGAAPGRAGPLSVSAYQA